MRVRTRIGGCLLVCVAMVASGLSTPDLAAATNGVTTWSNDTGGAAGSAGSRTVTLVTGDRLTVAADGSNRVAVAPAKGREGIALAGRIVSGHLNVTPVDVLPMVRSGRLDSRLFDVTALLAYGYDDRRAELPLIVTYADAAARATVWADAGTRGARVTRELPAVSGFAVRQQRRRAAAVWSALTTAAPAGATGAAARRLRPEIGRIWLDAVRKPSLDISAPMIGAPDAWKAGLTGAGVEVGVVDTGVDDTHPDLAGRVAASQNFTDEADNLDHVGHGTHVAGTIAGNGTASGGRYTGVAPGATISSAKVCVLYGCLESWIVAGMQWVAADRHVKVVNMSLGGPDTPELDPLEQAVEDLTTRYGTLFVIAAGNNGAGGTVSSPSTADAALSVGAVTKSGELAWFSSRGPRAGDSAIKPEITAPGENIVAAAGKDQQIGDPIGPDGRYMSLSGTSMATPHVAGSAALVLQRHPDLPAAALKATLMASAVPNPTIGVYAQGAGRVDAARAVTQEITTTPASVSFGLRPWPHGDDTPVATTVVYHNAGNATVTLDLALGATGPDGAPAPAGMFTVRPASVLVPAGGNASATVTADTSVPAPDGYFGGELTATAGAVTVRTPVAVNREPESYSLTLTHLDRTGAPTGMYFTDLLGIDMPSWRMPYDPSGTVTIRLPRARYLVSSMFFPADGQPVELTQLTQPTVTLDRDTTVTLDARTGKPFSITLPRPEAAPLVRTAGFSLQLPGTGYGVMIIVAGAEAQIFTGQVGPDMPTPGFTAVLSGQWAKPEAQLNSPYQYLLSFHQPGRMFDGLTRTLGDGDLAGIDTRLNAEATGARGEISTFDMSESVGFGVAAMFDYDLPSRAARYVNGGPDLTWATSVLQVVPSRNPDYPFPEPISDLEGAPIGYQAGRTYHETWNEGVFGPALDTVYPGVMRTGDTMIAIVPLYSDGAGHAGFGMTGSLRLTVERDGIRVGESDRFFAAFDVPSATGRYTVTMTGTRGAPFTLSTQDKVVWTFDSAHVEGKAPVPVPLPVVRFLPRLDESNNAPAGQVFRVPVQVSSASGAVAGPLRSLAVWVSSDDGANWQQVPVFTQDGQTVIEVRQPRGTGFVSLRAAATDAAGSTVEETIIRAYRY